MKEKYKWKCERKISEKNMTSLTWPPLVPYRKYLSLPCTQHTETTGQPDMKVAEVTGAGEQVHT